jgi:hypothetical protein
VSRTFATKTLRHEGSLRKVKKIEHAKQNTLFILALAIMGCSQIVSESKIDQTDSLTKSFSTLGEYEQIKWEYYQSIERALANKGDIQVEKIPGLMQSLIDKGAIPKPIIFIDGTKGSEQKEVDYTTYKDFREKNPIDSKKQFTLMISPSDSLLVDSMRRTVLKLLSEDSIKN